MYAIVEMNGQQFKVEEGKKIFVQHIQNAEAGQTVEFDKVLLVDNEGAISVGTPTVEGAKKAELEELKAQEVVKLEQISGLTAEQAKEYAGVILEKKEDKCTFIGTGLDANRAVQLHHTFGANNDLQYATKKEISTLIEALKNCKEDAFHQCEYINAKVDDLTNELTNANIQKAKLDCKYADLVNVINGIDKTRHINEIIDKLQGLSDDELDMVELSIMKYKLSKI